MEPEERPWFRTGHRVALTEQFRNYRWNSREVYNYPYADVRGLSYKGAGEWRVRLVFSNGDDARFDVYKKGYHPGAGFQLFTPVGGDHTVETQKPWFKKGDKVKLTESFREHSWGGGKRYDYKFATIEEMEDHEGGSTYNITLRFHAVHAACARRFTVHADSKHFNEPIIMFTRTDEMSDSKDKETAKARLSGLIKEGAYQGASSKAADTIVEQLRKALGDSYPKFFDSPLGHAVEPVVVCALVDWLLTEYAPKSDTTDLVAKAARLAIVDKSSGFVHLLLDKIMPSVPELASQLSVIAGGQSTQGATGPTEPKVS